jgi:hypothetical protein
MKLHRFSATDYYRMGELGLLMPDFRSLRLDHLKASPIDSATPAVGPAAAPGPQKHIFPYILSYIA